MHDALPPETKPSVFRQLARHADTYTITSPDEVRGRHVGSIINAVTGYEVATFTDGGHMFDLPVNVALCSGCDTPPVDGRCANCEEPVEHDDTAVVRPMRRAPVRSAICGARGQGRA